jgi:diguanylate cyclase (GGDEF)-like protein
MSMKTINDRYEIIKEIGAGEYGFIYQVRDTADKAVPVKALKLFDSDKHGKNPVPFFEEYWYTRSVTVTCSVKVFDFNRVYAIDEAPFHGDYFYYTMEFVDGLTLADYLFIDKEEKKEILERIATKVRWMHANGFWHGDLSPDNIIISFDKDIVFIDFFPHGHIQEEEKAFKTLMDEMFGFSVERFWSSASSQETAAALLRSISRRHGFSPALIEPALEKLHHFVRNTKNKDIPLTFYNMVNFSEDYFSLAMHSIKPLLVMNGYITKEILVNEDPYSFIRELYFGLLHDPRLKEIFTSEKSLKDSLKGLTYESFSNIHKTYARFLMERILEGLHASGNTAIIIRNIRTADPYSKEVIRDILHEHTGKNLILFINDNIEREAYCRVVGQNWLLEEDFTNPAGQEYRSFYCRTLDSFLLSGLTGLSFTHLCSMEHVDLLEAMRFLTYQDLSRPSSQIKDLIASFDPQRDKDLFYDSLLSDTDLRLLLYQIYFMDNPSRISFLSELAGSKFQRLFQQLVIESVLLPGAEQTVYFADPDLFSRLGKEIRALPEEQQSKLAEKVMSLYERHEEILSPQEKIVLIITYSRAGLSDKAMEYLFRHFFVRSEASESLLKSNLYWYIKILYESMKKDPGRFSSRSQQILHISFHALAPDATPETIITALEKLDKSVSLDADIRMVLYTDMARRLYVLSRTEKMKSVIETIKGLIPLVPFDLAYAAYRAEIQYYYSIRDLETMIRLCRSLALKVKSAAAEADEKRAMDLISYYSLYYRHQGQMKKHKNLLDVFLKKARQLNDPRHLYIAHTNYGMHYYLLGDKELSHHHFQLAARQAEAMQDFYYLMQAYNNLAVNEPDPEKLVQDLFQALKYTEFTEDSKNKILILYNLIDTIPPGEGYSLYMKHKDFILEQSSEDAFITLYRGLLYFSLVDVLITLGKRDELTALKKFITAGEITNPYASDARTLRELLLKKITVVLGDKASGIMKDFPELLRDASGETINSFKSFLFETASCALSKAEFLKAASALIEWHRRNEMLQSIGDIMVWLRLESNPLFKKDPRRCVRYIRLYYQKSPYAFIRSSVRLHLARALKSLDDPSYLCELSRIAGILSRDCLPYHKENPLMDRFRKDFPSEFETLMVKKKTPLIRVNDFSPLIAKLKTLADKNLGQTEFFTALLPLLVHTLHFDRAVFVKNTFGQLEESMSYESRPHFFSSTSRPAYEEYLARLKDTPFPMKVKNHPEIKNLLILPLINRKIWTRAREDSRYKRSTSLTHVNYIEAFIYLDQSHEARVSYNQDALNILLLYLNEYWHNRLSEDKYMRDKLTGLYFREVFIRKLSDLVFTGGERQTLPISLLMIDVDNYKEINDIFGHQRGDAVLRDIASLLDKAIRGYDLAGRYGGDEFILALPNTSPATGRLIANRIRDRIEKAQLMGLIRKITVSVGLSHYPTDSRLLEELIQKADHCLLQAKKMGKNTVVTTHSALRS